MDDNTPLEADDSASESAPDAEVSNQALVPMQQRQVEFYGDQIIGVLIQRGEDPPEWYVPLRPIAEFLGLDWSSQRKRTLDDPVLAETLISVVINTTQKTGRGHGSRPMVCLPLEYLPGWLFGLNASKVRAGLADKIMYYRRECFHVLWQAFKADILPPTPPAGDLSGAALAYEIATAVQHLARQEMELEARLGEVAGKQEIIADYVRKFIQDYRQRAKTTDARLISLELQLSSGAKISEAQASEIMLTVRLVGQALAAKGAKADYATVHNEMYKLYGISSYKNLPAAHYDSVMAWLAGWYEELTGHMPGGEDAAPGNLPESEAAPG